MKNKRNKNLLWRIHHWLGLYVGIVIAALSVTGALAVFIPEIDFWLTSQYYHLPKGEKYQDFTPLLTQVSANYPGYKIQGIMPPQQESDPLIFDFYNNDPKDAARFHVYVNPYNGTILGTKDHYNGLANYLRQLHVRMLDTLYGRQLVGTAGIGLFIISLTGILIYGKFMKKQSFGEIRKGRGLRIWMADWHKLIGITALAFNMLIAATGVWLGWQAKIIDWLDLKAPNAYKRPELLVDKKQDIHTPIEFYALIEKSKTAILDFVPTHVIPSVDGTSTVEIQGDIDGLPFEPHISKIIFDKASGEEIHRFDIRDQGLGAQLWYIQEGLHFGRFGGIWLKIAYALLGLTSGILSITGYVIYLSRNKQKYPTAQRATKKVFVYSAATLGIFILLGLSSVWIGYTFTSDLVTPCVYIFLFVYLSYQLFSYWRKKQSGKLEESIKNQQVG